MNGHRGGTNLGLDFSLKQTITVAILLAAVGAGDSILMPLVGRPPTASGSHAPVSPIAYQAMSMRVQRLESGLEATKTRVRILEIQLALQGASRP